MFKKHRKPRFDFDQFFSLTLDGARAAFTAVREAHPEKTIYGYGLFSHDDADGLSSLANSEEALQQKLAKASPEQFEKYPMQREYYRLCMNEWVHDDGAAALEPASRLLCRWGEYFTHGKEFFAHKCRVFDTSIRVLEALIEEGFFGSQHERQHLFIHFSLPDTFQTEVMIESSRRLNTPAVFARHMAAKLY